MLTNNMNCHCLSSQKFILAFFRHFTGITRKKGSGCLLYRIFQGQASADFDARGGIGSEHGARAGGLEARAERERWVNN